MIKLDVYKRQIENSVVPVKIQLGVTLTEGRGAGNMPEMGEQAARENYEDIKDVLKDTTKMLFIAAGMGGGTGTGAAPVIASLARELDIDVYKRQPPLAVIRFINRICMLMRHFLILLQLQSLIMEATISVDKF